MHKQMEMPLEEWPIPEEDSTLAQGMASPTACSKELPGEAAPPPAEASSAGGSMPMNLLATAPVSGATTESLEQARTFEALFEAYYRPLSGFLYRMLGDVQLAQDVTQDCFIKLHLAMVAGQQMANVRAWLYRVATNAALDERRRRRRITWLPLLSQNERHDTARLDPEDHAVLRDRLQQVLAGISPNLSVCLLLHLHHGFSHDEIAAILGISSGAARTRLQRGREAFKARWLAMEERETSSRSDAARPQPTEGANHTPRRGRSNICSDQRDGGSHETSDA